ncbi:uncharacterized protein RBU33_014125 isoform 1-T1 [Hipposideros larvatus]
MPGARATAGPGLLPPSLGPAEMPRRPWVPSRERGGGRGDGAARGDFGLSGDPRMSVSQEQAFLWSVGHLVALDSCHPPLRDMREQESQTCKACRARARDTVQQRHDCLGPASVSSHAAVFSSLLHLCDGHLPWKIPWFLRLQNCSSPCLLPCRCQVTAETRMTLDPGEGWVLISLLGTVTGEGGRRHRGSPGCRLMGSLVILSRLSGGLTADPVPAATSLYLDMDTDEHAVLQPSGGHLLALSPCVTAGEGILWTFSRFVTGQEVSIFSDRSL